MGSILWIIIMVLIVITDQVSKQIVAANVKTGELIPVIDNFFYITYHTNTGAAWGILQDKRHILIPLTIIFSLVMIYILFKTKDKLLKLALSLVLGGAIGNLIDRMVKGGVADFLDFYFGSYHFPTFN
ncbi:MAG: signal peptidase II, partial [Clostridiaceae bacterium]|nr:signal peptidase II [Clostridiaceae bacterium]